MRHQDAIAALPPTARTLYPSAVSTTAPLAVGEGLAALSWRTLVSRPHDGATNMAIDSALLQRAAATGEATLRIYEWASPVISLGRHQRARGCYDLARAAAAGVSFVRRPTGGRAVFHHHEVTYSVAAPVRLGTLRESFTAISRLIVSGLARLGVQAWLAGEGRRRAPVPGLQPCFAEPVAGEILVGGRKLVGSAQYRDRDAILQQGSILVENDQRLASWLLRGAPTASTNAIGLHEVVGRELSAHELAHALFCALEAVGAETQALSVDDPLTGAAAKEREKFDDDAWTWRR